jgi:lipopolysaccharide biosynthesis glycosyltransferase
MLKIFIGYDPKEIPAYHTCVQSIIDTCTVPFSVTPLALKNLKGIYDREDTNATTEFSLTRFLVPYLSNYEGRSIFMDCDFLVKTDLSKLVSNLLATNNIVDVCQHNYTPKTTSKATGTQSNYPKKNWSSFMVFNNRRCKILTPEYVNTATPAQLHRMEWSEETGELPLDFNWLVGEYEHNDNARVLHYTLGTPCFDEYKNCDHSEEWHKVHNLLK